ncbi:hypothetical protein EUA50_03105 [Staphylococcus saprophyticus]|nr:MULTISPECIES: hypothetical protein [Staphylococcus]MDL1993689.1 hypothetical protein [Staphylococcus saprophyticus]MDT3919455.1 hypothetical protein [Staphylococcus saprophyticus]MDT3924753.1 hypothetical protein [Staphylococcus saprophyticus]MDT3977742.1 hypothetical protein [Staphylococcus saprophyticus]MDT3984996.1 hypothetical protein [Staphylococcus saprophyticus]
MDKDKVFKKLDEAKEYGLTFRVEEYSTLHEPDEDYKIKSDYSYEVGYLMIKKLNSNAKIPISFDSIFAINLSKDSLIIKIREDRA